MPRLPDNMLISSVDLSSNESLPAPEPSPNQKPLSTVELVANVGVVIVGLVIAPDVLITTFPLPVIALLTRFLEASVKTAWLAVRPDILRADRFRVSLNEPVP